MSRRRSPGVPSTALPAASSQHERTLWPRVTRRSLVAAVFVVAAVLAVLATTNDEVVSSAQADSASPSAEGATTTLQVGWTQNLDSLNPFIGYQNVSYDTYFLNYDRLVQYHPETMEPIPGLAESWEYSEDGKTWTFHIRDDATWQDGEPLTAHDVAFTFTYIIDNELAAFTNYTTHIKKVTATDDYTVRFDLDSPTATMLQMWVPILPEHIWGKIPAEKAETTFKNDPPVIGSGPFQVVEWKRNRYVRMVANKDYWGGAPKIDEIMFRIYSNNETMAADLQKGVLDMSNYVDAAQFKRFEDREGWKANAAVENSFENLGMNCYEGPSKGNPALRDPAFRTALSWAIDREAIARIAFNGRATPATGLLPSDFWSADLDYHWEPPADEKITYDPAKAKELLDAAGYRDTDGDGIRENDGKPIELRLWAVQEKAAYTNAAKLISGWLADVGIGTDMKTLDDGTVSDGIYAYEGDTFTPDYDMFIWGWSADPDPNFVLSIFLTNQIENWSDCCWSNAEYDRLYAEQEAAIDPQARKALVHQMQELLYKDNPYLVLVYPQTLEVYNTEKWQGWVLQPAGTGSVNNYWTYVGVAPRAAVSESGSNTRLIIGIVAAAVVVIGVAAFLVIRRRGTPREEEV